MGELRTFLQSGNHGFRGDVSELECHIQFIQQHKFHRCVSQIAECGLPRFLNKLLIPFAVLGFPGETLSERMPAHLISEDAQGSGLPWLPAALDELNDGNPFIVTERAEHKPEPCGGFSFPVAGEHQHKALLLVAFLHTLPLHLLASFHPLAVAGLVGFRRHSPTHAQAGGGLV